jgi:hypothetical protein
LPTELPFVCCGQLLPGEALFLYTDGAEDARDARGRFFPLRDVLAEAAAQHPLPVPQSVLGSVFTALLRHAGGTPTDDVAILILSNDRKLAYPHLGARGCDISGSAAGARSATTHPPPTNYRQPNGV